MKFKFISKSSEINNRRFKCSLIELFLSLVALALLATQFSNDFFKQISEKYAYFLVMKKNKMICENTI